MSKKKYMLVTRCGYVGTETYHEIDDEHETEEDALEAFGGTDAAVAQTEEDVMPEFHVEEYDEGYF
ncbi:MAG: hypothetical protein GY861_13805 [bacterium]|nr:hypothetical protein [bacterium]